MDYTFVIPVLVAFGLSVVMGPIVIPILRKMKMKQTERVEGVESHLKKAGTPTMGGVMILASVLTFVCAFTFRRHAIDRHEGIIFLLIYIAYISCTIIFY